MKNAVLLASLILFGLGTTTAVTSVGLASKAEARGGGCPLTVPDDWRKCALCPFEC